MSLLLVRGLYKRLGGRALIADLELDVAAGQTAFVLGANGSGKSTLLRLACGLLDPDRGDISIAGHSLAREPRLAKAALGYVPDGLESLPDLRVSELVKLTRALRGLPVQLPQADVAWQQRLGVDSLQSERLQTLSFGQRKRVALFCASAGDPPLLLLDEPSNGLDPGALEVLLELLDERQRAGKSQLVATNDLDLLARVEGPRHRLVSGRLECEPRG